MSCKRLHLLGMVAIASVFASTSSGAIVEFGASTGPLPYAEDGLSFVGLSGASLTFVGGLGDPRFVAGTNVTPIHMRVSGADPFNLHSLDIEQLFRNWRIESSSGAVMALTGVGTVDLSASVGWTNIDYFDVIHNPAEANGSIQLDNVVFEFVPEPSASVVIMGAIAYLLLLFRSPRAFRLGGTQHLASTRGMRLLTC